jgi:hypothetical protein
MSATVSQNEEFCDLHRFLRIVKRVEAGRLWAGQYTLVGNTVVENPLEKSFRRLVDITKTNLKLIGCEDGMSLELVQEYVLWQETNDSDLNLRVLLLQICLPLD